MKKVYEKRFNELEEELKNLEATKKTSSNGLGMASNFINNELFIKWKTKVKETILQVYTKESNYFINFEKQEEGLAYDTNYDITLSLKSVFLAAKEDFEKGYYVSNRSLIQAEIYDSELEQATELLNNGYISPAAVIAGVVLETTLRELCDNQSPVIPHGKLDKMNSDLVKAGVYNKFKQKQITALADIRNCAAHGKSDEFDKEDVKNMIRDVEKFLADYLPD